MTGKRARRRSSGQDAAAAGLAATDCAAVEAELESELVSSANPAFDADDAVVRRTKDGWRVGDDELPDLTCAMILADLDRGRERHDRCPGRQALDAAGHQRDRRSFAPPSASLSMPC